MSNLSASAGSISPYRAALLQKKQSGYRSFVRELGPNVVDQYALTMTCSLWRAWQAGLAQSPDIETTSLVFCRELVKSGVRADDANANNAAEKIPYIVNAGLGLVMEWLEGWNYNTKPERLAALARQKTPEGDWLFPDGFLQWLSAQKITLDIDAVPEGELIFPHQPVLRLRGKFWQQQVVEAAFLHFVGPSANLATIAAQFREAATQISGEKAALFEFGLRRSPDIGGLKTARAIWIAGWQGTSNMYAAECYELPTIGTHAHAYVMLHSSEIEAFGNWAKTMPYAGIFLVDTYDTLSGVANAIAACKEHGIKLKGIRLDSGNLDELSQQARVLLDAAGHKDAMIFATDNLNVQSVYDLIGAPNATAKINSLGVGSQITGAVQNPLLSFVQKVADVREPSGELRKMMKFSSTAAKATLPGDLKTIRLLDAQGKFAADILAPAEMDVGQGTLRTALSGIDAKGRKQSFAAGMAFYEPMQPLLQAGQAVQPAHIAQDGVAVLAEARALHAQRMQQLPAAHKALVRPTPYPAFIEVGLQADKEARVAANNLATKARVSALPRP